ncbi:MAG: sugar ABC transporter permease [Actinobacteria bacterium BACL2 MAG-121220-bin52]|jgi:N,N'-diacetylchitobiose transport system permease protein|uniref:Sugar ABC transporter permease n=3 Tax=ac1 cluster TaxID=1655545 RepID=A0A0R2P4U9_9ACTN|nr:MAG: sugar ABC transporter permease [Actinobacteria bacterium BACL2 MAG-120802-bin41]KRO33110.1 MAG: sugar ABC transporter permease [Actinobacteria bacterium BACL2 MAG-121220-bin52]
MHRKSSVYANISGFFAIIFMGFPVYWMVTTSFKNRQDVLSTEPTILPRSFTIENYQNAFSREGFYTSLRNSLIVVLITVAISLFLATFASVAIARTKFTGKRSFISALLIVQMLPLSALIIPLFLLLTRLQLTNTIGGLALTYVAFILPFTIWTLRGFLANIPTDIEEAALVDGCTRVQAYRHVLLPLMAPGLVATAIFAFIQAWNEFLLAYIIMQSQENLTLPVWLASFTTRTGTDWGPLMAASTVTAIPVVIFFSLIQKRIATGVTAGAVKG